MRCNNCGWDNPINAINCEKCNNSIHGTISEKDKAVLSEYQNDSSLERTIKGAIAPIPYIDRPDETPSVNEKNLKFDCPFCGYPNPADAKRCLQCRKELNELQYNQVQYKDQSSSQMKTQTPWSKKNYNRFTLKELKLDNEYGCTLEFTGEEIILNRANTIQHNQTITSKEQAYIEFKDGKWFLFDKSNLRTTFISSIEPIEIKKGDIILLGDTRFEFDK